MFVGHYGVSFAAKAFEHRIPLWLLFVAVQFVDVLWAVLVLLGIEHVRIVPGITASNPLDLYYMPYTHSLVAAAFWSGLALLGYKLLGSRSSHGAGRAARFLALAVFSHWVLDLVVHRPDLPLYDDVHKLGLGLWNYPMLALALEAGLLFGGLGLYVRSTRGISFRGKYGIPLFGVAMLVVHCLAFFGPPPPSPSAAAVIFLSCYLLLALAAFWLEKKRSVVVS